MGRHRKNSGPAIAEIKTAVRERDGYRCTGCGLTNDQSIQVYGVSLDVHRRVPGSLYTVEGCVTLCKSCHGPQPKRKKREPDLGHPGYLLMARIDPLLGEAFESWVASIEPRVSKKAALEFLLQSMLQAKGFWPPPSPEGEGEGE